MRKGRNPKKNLVGTAVREELHAGIAAVFSNGQRTGALYIILYC